MHLLQLALQVISIHVKVVACEDIAIDPCIDTEKISALFACLTMSDYLLVPSDMGRSKRHAFGCL